MQVNIMDDLDDDCIVELSELDEDSFNDDCPPKLVRPEMLNGYSYKIKAPNQQQEMVNLYLTINHNEDNQIFEMFLDISDQAMYEWLTAIMRLASKLMQVQVPIPEIVKDLKDIHSTTTGHHIPNTQGIYAKSVVARIAHELEKHYEKYCSTEKS